MIKYLILILPLFLIGCGHTPEEVIIEKPIFIPVVCEDFGRIDPVRALPVVFVQAKTDEGYNVLGLRGNMYSNLSVIFRDTLRYIGEQNKAISYYKGCISDHNANIPKKEGEPN